MVGGEEGVSLQDSQRESGEERDCPSPGNCSDAVSAVTLHFVTKMPPMLQLSQQAPVPAPEPAHHGRGEEVQCGSSPPSTRGLAGWALPPGWQQNTSLEA